MFFCQLGGRAAERSPDSTLEQSGGQGGINKRAIAKIAKDIEREFAKHPIRIPLETDGPEGMTARFTGSTVFNGPVIHGSADGAVLAWNNGTANQVRNHTEATITPGYEAIAQAVASTLQGLKGVGLSDVDEKDAQAAGEEVLAEVVEQEPDRGKVRRALSALKGYLSPVATGLSQGAGEGAQEWTKTAIEQLGTPF